jgi:hypothetical protein
MILFIDAETSFIKPVMDILAQSGVPEKDIVLRSSIPGALQAIETGKVTCICMEMLLPDPMKRLTETGDINGLKLLRIIRNMTNVPVVGYTLLDKKDGDVKRQIELMNGVYIGKTEKNGCEKLIGFCKTHYK